MLAGGADALRRAAHSLERGRKAIDRAIARSRRGQVFSQEELISMQAEVYRYSQELELAGRLVDKAVGAIRQTLQSQT